MKTRLIKLAARQKSELNIAALLGYNLRRGAISAKRHHRTIREIAAWKRTGLASEQELLRIVINTQRDIEDRAGLDLMGAIHRLTAFRVSRLAYAGRVLP